MTIQESVLLVEDDGLLRFRIATVPTGDTILWERRHLAGIGHTVHEWRCVGGERSLGSLNPETGLQGLRIFREVLPPPPPETPECPTFDELRVKVELQ